MVRVDPFFRHEFYKHIVYTMIVVSVIEWRICSTWFSIIVRRQYHEQYRLFNDVSHFWIWVVGWDHGCIYIYQRVWTRDKVFPLQQSPYYTSCEVPLTQRRWFRAMDGTNLLEFRSKEEFPRELHLWFWRHTSHWPIRCQHQCCSTPEDWQTDFHWRLALSRSLGRRRRRWNWRILRLCHSWQELLGASTDQPCSG